MDRKLGCVIIKYLASKMMTAKFEFEDMLDHDFESRFTELLSIAHISEPAAKEYHDTQKLSIPCSDQTIKDNDNNYINEICQKQNLPLPCLNFNFDDNRNNQIPCLDEIIQHLTMSDDDKINAKISIYGNRSLNNSTSKILLLQNLLKVISLGPIDFEQHYQYIFELIFYLKTHGKGEKQLRFRILFMIITLKSKEMNDILSKKFFAYPSTTYNFTQKLEILLIISLVASHFNKSLGRHYQTIYGITFFEDLSNFSNEHDINISSIYLESLFECKINRDIELSSLEIFLYPWLYEYYKIKDKYKSEKNCRTDSKGNSLILGTFLNFICDIALIFYNQSGIHFALKAIFEIFETYHDSSEKFIKRSILHIYDKVFSNMDSKSSIISLNFLDETGAIKKWLNQSIQNDNDEINILLAFKILDKI
ncbi:unnamed protein product [Gordionus sp. m RMFG-2023]